MKTDNRNFLFYHLDQYNNDRDKVKFLYEIVKFQAEGSALFDAVRYAHRTTRGVLLSTTNTKGNNGQGTI